MLGSGALHSWVLNLWEGGASQPVLIFLRGRMRLVLSASKESGRNSCCGPRSYCWVKGSQQRSRVPRPLPSSPARSLWCLLLLELNCCPRRGVFSGSSLTSSLYRRVALELRQREAGPQLTGSKHISFPGLDSSVVREDCTPLGTSLEGFEG